ncbi:MAG: thiamine phosphate synthase [Acidobacteriota bacterium]
MSESSSRNDLRREIVPLYVLADAGALGDRDLADAVEAIAQSGVRWIQLRAKDWPDDRFYSSAERCLRVLEGSSTTLWINDRADLAALLGAGGLHVGQEDLPPAVARRVLDSAVWVGQSTHNLGQMRAAASDDAVDVVAVGPVFETQSKKNPDPTVGLELVRSARRETQKPVVAIGGIDSDNAGAALEAGADAVAVISAICGASDLERACRDFLEGLESARGA